MNLTSIITLPIALLAGLAGLTVADAGSDALDPELAADLASLNEAERRVVHALASALLQNRAE